MKEYNMAAVMKIRGQMKETEQKIHYHETVLLNSDRYAKSVIEWSEQTLADLRKDMESLETEHNEKLAKLQAELDAVQKTSRVRTISTLGIIRCLTYVEDHLGISKRAMDGIVVEVDDNAQHFPKSYKGRPESTWFRAEYRKGSWRITAIWRGDTEKSGNGYSIRLTETARAALLAKYTRFCSDVRYFQKVSF